jgi:hypothetical protein
MIALRCNCLTTSSQTPANGSVRVRHARVRWFSLGSVDNRMYFRAVFGSMLACSATSFKVVLGLNRCRSRSTCSSFTIERALPTVLNVPQAPVYVFHMENCFFFIASCWFSLVLRFLMPAWFSHHSPSASPPRLRERPLANPVDCVGHLPAILRISNPPPTSRTSCGSQQENGGP